MKVGSVQGQATPTLSRRDLYFKRKLKFQSCFDSAFLLISLNLNQDLEEEIYEKHIAVALFSSSLLLHLKITEIYIWLWPPSRMCFDIY